MDWFLYDNDLRHERVKLRRLISNLFHLMTLHGISHGNPIENVLRVLIGLEKL